MLYDADVCPIEFRATIVLTFLIFNLRVLWTVLSTAFHIFPYQVSICANGNPSNEIIVMYFIRVQKL